MSFAKSTLLWGCAGSFAVVLGMNDLTALLTTSLGVLIGTALIYATVRLVTGKWPS